MITVAPIRSAPNSLVKAALTQAGSSTFQDVADYLRSLHVLQIMSNDHTYCANSIDCWRLFGYMFNAFGICVPIYERYSYSHFGVHTRGRVQLSEYQKRCISQHRTQVLVASHLEVSIRASGEGAMSLKPILESLQLHAINKCLSACLPIAVVNMIGHFLVLPTVNALTWHSPSVVQ